MKKRNKQINKWINKWMKKQVIQMIFNCYGANKKYQHFSWVWKKKLENLNSYMILWMILWVINERIYGK